MRTLPLRAGRADAIRSDRAGRAAFVVAATSALAMLPACRADPASEAPPSDPAPGPVAATSATAAPSAEPEAASSGATATPAAPVREIAGAAHILVAYKGAERAPKSVTRTKDQARKRALEVLAKVKEGKKEFAELVKEYSDDEASRPANGALGNFERNAMHPAFSDATFALQVGDTSGVVETPAGFHIIRRTR